MSKPMSEEAYRLLSTAPRVEGCPYVLPSPSHPGQHLTVGEYYNGWCRVLKAAGVVHAGTHGIRYRSATDIEPPRVCRRPPSLALRRASGAHQIPIVDFLCLRRRYVPKRAEQPMVVIPVNPFERGELDVLECTP